MSINKKNCTDFGKCFGQHAGLRRKELGFNAALGFDFMHFLMSISGWGKVEVIK